MTSLCDRHGIAMIGFGSRLACPRCLADASRSRLAIHDQIESRRAKTLMNSSVINSGIPEIYRDANFAQMKSPASENDRQVFLRVAKAMHRYGKEFSTFRTKRSGFLFTGESGSGKTHMACAIANLVLQQGMSVRYTSLPSLTTRIRATFNNSTAQKESVAAIYQELSCPDLLILDEIDLHGASMSDFHALYEIINTRYSSGNLPIIAISNRSKEFLVSDLGDRLIDRILGSSAEIRFVWPSFRKEADASFANKLDR